MNLSAQPLPIVVAEWLSPRTRRVLTDTSCSFLDGSGIAHLARGAESIDVPRRDEPPRLTDAPRVDISVVVADAVAMVRSDPGRPYAWFAGDCRRLDDDSPRRPVDVVLEDPIDLLDWIARQPAASELHGGIQAYLYSSDPDRLLARPLSHPDPNPPDDAPSAPVVVTIARATVIDSASGDLGARPVAGADRAKPREQAAVGTIDLGSGLALLVDLSGAGR
jgi:hypothetical protein